MLSALWALSSGHAVASDAAAAGWATTVRATEHTLGDGLPVLSLGADDWRDRISVGPGTARASQRLELKLLAQHPTGWRFGVVGRSQAQVEATSSTLALAKALDSKAFPSESTTFDLSASHLGWRGYGLEFGLPWLQVGDGGWKWTADVQWLRLADLRSNHVAGRTEFSALSRAYDFDASADRYSPRISGPFLPASSATGSGLSLSLAVEGQISPSVSLGVQAQDLISRLRWDRLARERLRLNTQVTSLRPDGFLDYGPAVTGRQSLDFLSTEIGARWETRVTWHYAPTTSFNARWATMSGMTDFWLGWDAGAVADGRDVGVSVNPARRAVEARWAWRGVSLVAGTDGRGAQSEFRRLMLGWQSRF